MKKIIKAVHGFTLIELLVVILIIGILAAVAVPQYQKAVLKSRFSALMPIAKSIANGNEVYYLGHGTYATSPDSLDVAGQATYPDGTELGLSTGEYSYVIVGKNNNFPMNYIVYQKHSGKFADNIHCEANENNMVAQEICQSLGGQYIPGSQTDGFVTYVLSGTVNSDKLPSSLTKLQSSVCEGKTGCTADIIGNQVVSHQCNSSAKQCVDTTYNANGDEVKKLTTQCNKSETYAKWENDKCIPMYGSAGNGNPYIQVFDENNVDVVGRYCTELSGGTCTIERVWRVVYNPDGTVSATNRHCQGVHEDGTCDVYRGSAYGASYDNQYGVGTDWTFQSIADYRRWNGTRVNCAEVDSETGECIRYK